MSQETIKRTRLSPEARKEQLVRIGAKMFAERPFSDVWIEDVAHEAGVSRALVYHYFPNKRDFYAAIVRHGIRGAYARTAPDDSLPPDQRVRVAIDRLVSYVESNAEAFRAVYGVQHSNDDSIRKVVREGRDLQIARICSYIIPDGDPPPIVTLAVEGWIALLDSMLLEWLDGADVTREQLIEVAQVSLAGSVVAALKADGREDRIAELLAFAPGFLGDR